MKKKKGVTEQKEETKMKEKDSQNEDGEEKPEDSRIHLATLHEDLTNTTPLTITEDMMAVLATLLLRFGRLCHRPAYFSMRELIGLICLSLL